MAKTKANNSEAEWKRFGEGEKTNGMQRNVDMKKGNINRWKSGNKAKMHTCMNMLIYTFHHVEMS